MPVYHFQEDIASNNHPTSSIPEQIPNIAEGTVGSLSVPLFAQTRDEPDVGRYKFKEKGKWKYRDPVAGNSSGSANSDAGSLIIEKWVSRHYKHDSGPGSSSSGHTNPDMPKTSSEVVYVRYGQAIDDNPSTGSALDMTADMLKNSAQTIPELDALLSDGSVTLHTHVFPSLYVASSTQHWTSNVALTSLQTQTHLPAAHNDAAGTPPLPRQRFKRPHKPGMFFASFYFMKKAAVRWLTGLAFGIPSRWLTPDSSWYWVTLGNLCRILMVIELVILPIPTVIFNFTLWFITRSRVRAIRRRLYALGTRHVPKWVFWFWSPPNYVWIKAVNVWCPDTFYPREYIWPWDEEEQGSQSQSFYTDDSNLGTWGEHFRWILQTRFFKIIPLAILISVGMLTAVTQSADMFSQFFYWITIMLIVHFTVEIPWYIYVMDTRNQKILFARYDPVPHFGFIWDAWQDAVHKYLKIRPNVPLHKFDVPYAVASMSSGAVVLPNQDSASVSTPLRQLKSPFPTEQSPVIGWSLAQLSRRLFNLNDGFPDLRATDGKSIRDEGAAIIHSVELRKFMSWKDWKHEFLVMNMTYKGTTYILHINRSWADSNISGGYAPPFNLGSKKPLDEHNEISIFLCGREEEKRREDTRMVASAIFQTR